jgi:UDP:flavonoid glycosyltransferase YjiC (YdhE family)
MALSPKRIIIAPLDWGLGHTTRCVPIIKHLRFLGHNILFAGNGEQQAFISQTFPDIDLIMLEGYRVRYSKRALMFTLLWQMPRLLKTIQAEHKWLKKVAAEQKIDTIISDNRYGLWHDDIPSVILTHQPNVLTGLGKAVDRLVRRLHYKYLGRFGGVWIPDLAGVRNLGGALSHPQKLPTHSHYVGWLSQFETPKSSSSRHILILLSGPEPQRSLLANKLWNQAKALDQEIVFVEGKAGVIRTDIPKHIRHIALANGNQLQSLIENASLVVCRSGYSTLMDLALVGKPAVLIPTPGQTEQEYLAASLAERGMFVTVRQKDIDLAQAIGASQDLRRWEVLERAELLLPVLEQWLEHL